MTRIDSAQLKWRVETKAKTGKWIKRGLYETRSFARTVARMYRGAIDIYGLSDVRVVRHISGKGKAP